MFQPNREKKSQNPPASSKSFCSALAIHVRCSSIIDEADVNARTELLRNSLSPIRLNNFTATPRRDSCVDANGLAYHYGSSFYEQLDERRGAPGGG